VRIAALLAALFGFGCSVNSAERAPASDSELTAAREEMVRDQIEARGVRDARVLAAMRRVPRHELVPENERALAYEDRPLPIGRGQTISQPYVVAAMTAALALDGSERVLEIGTGSGYQAAVLAELCREVYTIELEPELAQRARADLARLGYANVEVRQGDGFRGWPEHAPFDAVIVTAAPEQVPPPLIEQLAVGGRLVIPVGDDEQHLLLLRKTETGVERKVLFGVRFVPMRGEAERTSE
jgi:protein-L-isoaspartate(D-aspartate) O-methyltransferase